MKDTILLFLDIGGPEMMLILVAGLLLFGGQKLPELARGLGKGIRDFKDAANGVKEDLTESMNKLQDDKHITSGPSTASSHMPSPDSHLTSTPPSSSSTSQHDPLMASSSSSSPHQSDPLMNSTPLSSFQTGTYLDGTSNAVGVEYAGVHSSNDEFDEQQSESVREHFHPTQQTNFAYQDKTGHSVAGDVERTEGPERPSIPYAAHEPLLKPYSDTEQDSFHEELNGSGRSADNRTASNT